jgi:hypothetical protein
MSNIAYDLDGVILPDCDRLPNIGGLGEFYDVMGHVRPLFQPTGPYTIITARLRDYRSKTESWCKRYLNTQPEVLHHDISNDNAGAYKAQVLNANPQIQIYIESDPSIVEYLQSNVTTGCKIYLFSELVQTHIQTL